MNPQFYLYLIAGLVLGAAVAGCFFFLTRRNRGDETELLQRLELLDRAQERAERMLREEMSRGREENATAAKTQRDELTASLESVRSIVDLRLKQLQEDNSKQIDKMRATVDEKLQGTLERRLGESFKLVSDRLEQVHQGLGAMQQLASDVGGLQKVLSNVKTRGGWGEVQLGALLEQVLTQDQFARNVKTRSGKRRACRVRDQIARRRKWRAGLVADRCEISDGRLSTSHRGTGERKCPSDR